MSRRSTNQASDTRKVNGGANPEFAQPIKEKGKYICERRKWCYITMASLQEKYQRLKGSKYKEFLKGEYRNSLLHHKLTIHLFQVCMYCTEGFPQKYAKFENYMCMY